MTSFHFPANVKTKVCFFFCFNHVLLVPPDKPDTITCETAKSSSLINCSWTRGQETYLPTLYNISVNRYGVMFLFCIFLFIQISWFDFFNVLFLGKMGVRYVYFKSRMLTKSPYHEACLMKTLHTWSLSLLPTTLEHHSPIQSSYVWRT